MGLTNQLRCVRVVCCPQFILKQSLRFQFFSFTKNSICRAKMSTHLKHPYIYNSDKIERSYQNYTSFQSSSIRRISFLNTSTISNFKYVESCSKRICVQLYSTNANKGPEQPKTSSKDPEPDVHNETDCKEKVSLLQRFKQMYRNYWYVLVPVHIITSLGWFGGFYYLSKSGVDVVALLESLGVSERLTSPLKDSSAGYLAISYALYKIATPLRYTVTLGGTTLSINYLRQWGYIKPIPPTMRLKEMYHEKKDQIIDQATVEIKQRRDQLKEKRDSMLNFYKREKKE